MSIIEVKGWHEVISIHDLEFRKYAVVTFVPDGNGTEVGDVIYKGEQSTNNGCISNLSRGGCVYSHSSGTGIKVEVLPKGTEIKIIIE